MSGPSGWAQWPFCRVRLRVPFGSATSSRGPCTSHVWVVPPENTHQNSWSWAGPPPLLLRPPTYEPAQHSTHPARPQPTRRPLVTKIQNVSPAAPADDMEQREARAAGRAEPLCPTMVSRRIARLARKTTGRAPWRHAPPPPQNQKIANRTDPKRPCAGCAGPHVALFQSVIGLTSGACVVRTCVAVHAASTRRVRSATTTPGRLYKTILRGQTEWEECRPNQSTRSACAKANGALSTTRHPTCQVLVRGNTVRPK